MTGETVRAVQKAAIEARADRAEACRNLGPEKWPSSPFRGVIVDGVWITSRYQDHGEIERMAKVISGVPQARQQIAAMWCDSKATSVYTVEMHQGFDVAAYTRPIARQIAALLLSIYGGFNCVKVGTTAEMEADWGDLGDEDQAS